MRRNSGNALFLILIAIFLLGAVTAMLLRTSGTTEETGSSEKSSIKLSEMLRYASGLAQTVDRLRASGCSENDISFYSSQWPVSNTYDNPNSLNAAGNYNCHVFNSKGGGYTLKQKFTPFQREQTLSFGKSDAVQGMGTDKPELLLWIGGSFSWEECKKINNAVGNGKNLGGATPDPWQTPYDGSYPAVPVAIIDNPVLVGKKSGCVLLDSSSSGDTGAFFMVLISR